MVIRFSVFFSAQVFKVSRKKSCIMFQFFWLPALFSFRPTFSLKTCTCFFSELRGWPEGGRPWCVRRLHWAGQISLGRLEEASGWTQHPDHGHLLHQDLPQEDGLPSLPNRGGGRGLPQHHGGQQDSRGQNRWAAFLVKILIDDGMSVRGSQWYPWNPQAALSNLS